MEGITYRRRKYYHLMFTISLWLTKRQNQMGKFYTGVKKQNKNYTHDCDQNSWQNIQLRMVSQFPGTDDVHLSGRRESTETLGVNSIRSKGRYCFKTVLLSRNLFYILLWHTQIWILKWNLPCSGKFVSKKWVNKWHLDYFDGGVWSVITLVKSMWIKMRKYRNEHQKIELKPEVSLLQENSNKSQNVSLFNKTWTRPQITGRESKVLTSQLFKYVPLHFSVPAQTLVTEAENSNCA